LFGDFGVDTLSGGPGNDICVGITDSGDTFSSCEIISSGDAGLSGAWVEVSQQCNTSTRNPECKLKGTIAVENPKLETTAVPFVVAFFLSGDELWDENDAFLTSVEARALDGLESEEVRLHVKLEEGQSASGQFVIAVIDFFDAVPEQREDNNIVVSPLLP
jgi:hypothetical protein